jgi:SAM-dependent methyltransferase
MQTLDATFARLADDATTEHDIYTTLAPLYRVMYVARGRIEGQLAAVKDAAPPDATTAVELGCGTGHLLERLSSSFGRAVGADPSPTMVRIARERADHVCRADANAFASRGVDVAVLMGAVIGHIRPDAAGREAISQVRRSLRPGGRAVCSIHRRVESPRSRELTRRVGGYEITQRDEQRPTGSDTFEWAVTFEMTNEATGERRTATTTTSIRAFTPTELAAWFESAGFVDVETGPRTYVDGPGETDRAFLLTARRPES